MTRLEKLAADLRSLPERTMRAHLADRVAQYSGKVGTVSIRLHKIVGAEAAARTAFPDFRAEGAAEPVKRARRIAVELRGQVATRIEVLQERRTDEQIVALGEQAAKAERSVNERWSRQVKGWIDRYEGLVQAVIGAGLTSDHSLQAALNRLRQHQDAPPSTDGGGRAVRDAAERLATGVQNLGLEGAIGTFLVEASRGEASARALLDSEVLAFVDKYDLWRLLAVRFRG